MKPFSTAASGPVGYLEGVGGVVDEVDTQGGVGDGRRGHGGGGGGGREDGQLEQLDGAAGGGRRLADEGVAHEAVGHDVAPAGLELHEHRRVQRLLADTRQQLATNSTAN